MRKSDKKIDNELSKRLTDVCENELKSYVGFQWLTHLVNYANFPASLKIICVFDSNENLQRLHATAEDLPVKSAIINAIADIGVKVKDSGKLIKFDTQENCDLQHSGNWAKRLH